jgi:hypothetical protein
MRLLSLSALTKFPEKIRDFLASTRTIPTDRPPLVCEVSANFCEYRVSRDQSNGCWKQHDDFQCVFSFWRKHQEQLKNFPEGRDLVHLI